MRPSKSVARLARVLSLPGSELPSPQTTLAAAFSSGLTGGTPLGHNARAHAPIARYRPGTAGGRCHPGPPGLIPWSRTGAASRDHPSALGPGLVPVAFCSAWCDLGIPEGRGFPSLPRCTLSTGQRAASLTPTPPLGPDLAAVGSRSSWCGLGIPGGRGHPGLPGCTPLGRLVAARPCCRSRCDPGSPGGL